MSFPVRASTNPARRYVARSIKVLRLLILFLTLLGSSVSGIIMLLSKGFMQPVLIAIVIACPLGWILMEQWLQSFPYRTTISTWPFAVSGILVLLIAFMSVSSQAMRAAMTKPSETLKHE